MAIRQGRDESVVRMLGLLAPWTLVLGLAWIVCRVGGPLHWWPPGDTDRLVRSLVVRAFVLPLAVIGLVALPPLLWLMRRRQIGS